jgi:hypothetical protein
MFAEATSNGSSSTSIVGMVTESVKRRPGRPKGSKNGQIKATKGKKSSFNHFLESKDVRAFLALPTKIQESIRNLVTFGDPETSSTATEEDPLFGIEE